MSADNYFAIVGMVLIAPHVPFRMAGPVAAAALAYALFLQVVR